MSFKKIIHNNMVIIVTIPLIIGSHWFVNKLAEDETLVKPDERKDLLIVKAANAIKNKFLNFATIVEEGEDKK